MDLIRSCIPCIPNQVSLQLQGQHLFMTEKPDALPFSDDPVEQFLHILRTTDKDGKELEERLKSTISATSLSDTIAKRILDGIENILKRGVKIAGAMDKAVTIATNTAWSITQEHPYYASLIAAGTIIALGVLVMLAPWVIEVLGFGLSGPRAGSFAARWMSSIAKSTGHVSKNSIYSYLQRLGMTWHA
ncbi:hypothetical protein N3K66_008933 [Trichothecium roseum]|uniref:Uncharacterized protein n=1 Tax=Trichothecium roseum TaxID=47278 RepID=A0ACC0USX1_9HYPO|nr:hypothetical protein N3K66_008933 [Trichothecium roseum]